MGYEYEKKGNYEKAEELYKIGVSKNSEISIESLGLLYIKMKEYDLAKKYFLIISKEGYERSIKALNELNTKENNK